MTEMLERRTLLSVDTEENRFRFFVMELHLLGDDTAEVRRHWGRVAADGSRRVESFASLDEGRAHWDALLKRRFKRGYVDVDPAELDSARRLMAWHRSARGCPWQLAFPIAAGF